MRLIVILVMLGILASLGSALFHLVRTGRDGGDRRMVKALTWRIGLSVALFLALILAYSLGLIQPHDLGG
jgi:phosphotransferase system  glucose/maltose/N-acetylglucosamine-specific IIC component